MPDSCGLTLLAGIRHAAFHMTEPRCRGDAAMRSITGACVARPPCNHDRWKVLPCGAGQV